MSKSTVLIVPRKFGKKPYIIQPPIGLGYLAAALRNAGQTVQIIDACLLDLGSEEVCDLVRDYDIIGISAFSCEYSAAQHLARQVKQRYRNKHVIIGGPHVSALPMQVMRETPEFDFGFIGEAETSLVDFINAIQEGNTATGQWASIPGLIYRAGDEIRFTQPAFPEAESLPGGPAWDLIAPNRYPLEPNGIFSRYRTVTAIITGRGCPFHCTFCATRGLSGNRVRRRTIRQVIDEMRLLDDTYGIKEFNIVDSAFVVDGSFVSNLCHTMIDEGFTPPWSVTSGVRLDALTPEVVRLMENAGCYSMAVGIESGSQRVLDSMNKRLSLTTIKDRISMIKRHSSIRLTGFFIIGYPTENPSDVEETIRFALELPLDRANFFNFLPLPGTTVYEELLKNGLLQDYEPEKLYIHDFPFRHPILSGNVWKKLIRRANLQFYLRPHILWGIVKEVQSLDQIRIVMRRAMSILHS
ncbi:cobalamin-dependent protein [bacterium]|nr:cobalamin-dependent protein [candidate division CSSED10-310 bacterium]